MIIDCRIICFINFGVSYRKSVVDFLIRVTQRQILKKTRISTSHLAFASAGGVVGVKLEGGREEGDNIKIYLLT